ncbi:MAG: hypothetical protein DBY39_05665 [Clostridiales bacterium]|nr:MAG: hypothetical protein DBY39_05665 [Clostridiales bacterium]
MSVSYYMPNTAALQSFGAHFARRTVVVYETQQSMQGVPLFRATRRSARALSRQACIEIPVNKPRGAPAVHGEGGYPYAFSINQLHPGGKL